MAALFCHCTTVMTSHLQWTKFPPFEPQQTNQDGSSQLEVWSTLCNRHTQLEIVNNQKPGWVTSTTAPSSPCHHSDGQAVETSHTLHHWVLERTSGFRWETQITCLVAFGWETTEDVTLSVNVWWQAGLKWKINIFCFPLDVWTSHDRRVGKSFHYVFLLFFKAKNIITVIYDKKIKAGGENIHYMKVCLDFKYQQQKHISMFGIWF